MMMVVVMITSKDGVRELYVFAVIPVLYANEWA